MDSIQTVYQDTIKFVAARHAAINQTIPGTDLPYVVHLSNVAMEIIVASHYSVAGFNTVFAVQLALLHDILEDTQTPELEIKEKFGTAVLDGIKALTKNDQLTAKKMQDCLARILQQPQEVWAVKIADRITNLQIPPKHWPLEKIRQYRQEAILILETLQGANAYLEHRLNSKIKEYEVYCGSEPFS